LIMPKVAVYTIALNEEIHVQRWYESIKDADLLLIADTGSTDNTKELAESLGITVMDISVKPWRFDVARNASLALLPGDIDICIQLDMDEVMSPGWRPIVEQAFAEGNNWPLYKHVNGRKEDGTPVFFSMYYKIHPRHGFTWKFPIHEVIVPIPGTEFRREFIPVEADHIQDVTKSRSSYLDLLETAVREEPFDWRMNHYLCREYRQFEDWLKVLQSAYKTYALPEGWDVERASTCMWASEAADRLQLPQLAVEWAEKATLSAPHFYEMWHWRAHLAFISGNWQECRDFAIKILELQRQDHHLVKPWVWDFAGYDLLALSSSRLGLASDALKYGQMALDGAPPQEVERLSANLRDYQIAAGN